MLDDRLAALKARFVERAIQDLRTIENIDVAGTIGVDDCQLLIGTCHKLAGLSGTLGFAEISAAASDLERALVDQSDTLSIDAQSARLKHLLRGLLG